MSHMHTELRGLGVLQESLACLNLLSDKQSLLWPQVDQNCQRRGTLSRGIREQRKWCNPALPMDDFLLHVAVQSSYRAVHRFFWCRKSVRGGPFFTTAKKERGQVPMFWRSSNGSLGEALCMYSPLYDRSDFEYTWCSSCSAQ